MLVQAAVDTETTGLYSGIHEIVQLAIVPFNEQYEPMGRFVSYIRPMRPHVFMQEAFDVNKLTLEGLALQPTPIQVKGSFMDWKENCYPESKFVPLGHNYASFDSGFLKIFFGQEQYNNMFDYHVDDTCIAIRLLVKKGKLPKGVGSLTKALNHFGIKRNVEHDAYEDALATIKLYQKLVELI